MWSLHFLPILFLPILIFIIFKIKYDAASKALCLRLTDNQCAICDVCWRYMRGLDASPLPGSRAPSLPCANHTFSATRFVGGAGYCLPAVVWACEEGRDPCRRWKGLALHVHHLCCKFAVEGVAHRVVSVCCQNYTKFVFTLSLLRPSLSLSERGVPVLVCEAVQNGEHYPAPAVHRVHWRYGS